MSTLPTVSKYDLAAEIARALATRQQREADAEIERRAMRQAEDEHEDRKLLEELAPLLPDGMMGSLGIKGMTDGGQPQVGFEYPAGVHWELSRNGRHKRQAGDYETHATYYLSAWVGKDDDRHHLRTITHVFGDELAERLLVELGEIGPLVDEHWEKVAEHQAAEQAAAAARTNPTAALKRSEIWRQLDEMVEHDRTPKRSVAEVYGLLQREIYTLSVSPWDAGSTLRRLAAIAVGGLLLVDFDADEPVF